MARADTTPATSRVLSWRAVAVALIVYAVFLASTAPASLLAWMLGLATNDAIVLEDPQGSVWHGDAAALVVKLPSGSAHRFEGLHWEPLAARLLLGEFAARVQVDGPRLRGSGAVTLCRDGLVFRAAQFRLPAASLATYWPAVSATGLRGEIALRSDHLELLSARPGGKVVIVWRDAGTVLSTVNATGEYEALVTSNGARLEFSIETRGGPLRVEGRGHWSSQGLAFEGTARAAPEYRTYLADVLRFVGPERGFGIHQIVFPRR